MNAISSLASRVAFGIRTGERVRVRVEEPGHTRRPLPGLAEIDERTFVDLDRNLLPLAVVEGERDEPVGCDPLQPRYLAPGQDDGRVGPVRSRDVPLLARHQHQRHEHERTDRPPLPRHAVPFVRSRQRNAQEVGGVHPSESRVSSDDAVMEEHEADWPDRRTELLELYDVALPEVYGYLVRRCPTVALAEDLTGETFVAALDARAGVSLARRCRGWSPSPGTSSSTIGAGALGPRSIGGSPVLMNLRVPDVDQVVARAIDAGAVLVQPVEDQFYGERSGTIIDPFGHTWMVRSHVEDVSPDEVTRRWVESERAREGDES